MDLPTLQRVADKAAISRFVISFTNCGENCEIFYLCALASGAPPKISARSPSGWYAGLPQPIRV